MKAFNEQGLKDFEVSLEGAGNKRIFVYLHVFLSCCFYSLGSGIDRFFSWNCDVRFWRAKQQHKFRAYLLIKQSLLIISTDIQRLFEEYLHPPGRRSGIIKPLILDESPACLKEPRCVFVLKRFFFQNRASVLDLRLICQTSMCVSFGNGLLLFS